MKKIMMIVTLAIFSIAMASLLDSDRAPNDNLFEKVVSNPSVYSDDPGDPITWTTMTPCPSAGRYWCPGHGVVRDTIWYCGGRSPAGSINEIIAYVPATNSWVTTGLPTLLTPRRAGGGGQIGNKIYVVGGRDASNTTLSSCEEFDVVNRTVTTKASMPAAAWSVASAVAGGKLYIMGNENYGTANYEYDPATNTWTAKAPLPTGRGWAAAVGAGGKVYLIGGVGAGSVWLNTCHEFDPVTNTWTQKANMPGPRGYHAAVAVNDEDIYVLGGAAGTGANADNLVYKYNIPSNTWTVEQPMPTARGWEMPDYYNNALYVFGGSQDWGTTVMLNVMEKGSLAPPPQNDVGVEEILSPGAFHTPNTIMTPQALVKNYGTATQTNFQVVCSIVGPGGVFRYFSSKTVSSLASYMTTTVVFDTWRPTIQESLRVMMKTMLVNDTNPENDRKTRTCLVSNISQIIIGTATTNQRTEPLDRYYNYNTHEVIYLQSEIGVACNILSLAYQKASGSNLDPITPVEIYMCHTTETSLPTGSVTLPPPPPYELVYSGPFPNDVTSGWLEVNLTTPFYYNNAENLKILIVKGYQQWISSGYPYWNYTTTSPTYLTRGGRSDTQQPTSLTATYNRPNIRLTVSPQAPPTNDVGVTRIIAPAGSYQVGTPIIPSAVVKNYGTANQTNFPVICSIIGPAKTVRYVNTQTISLAAGDTMVVNFGTYTPTITEYESVFVRTALTGDERPNNDRKSRGFLVHSYMLLEGFNDVVFPPPGWQANIINGTYNWERFTAGVYPTCSPYEGEAMAGYRSFNASAGSMARLISPPVNCGTTPQPINVIFNMYHDPGYPGELGPDSIKVEYSTDGINFTQVASFKRYDPTAAWQEHTVNLGTFSGTLYVGFLAFSEYGNNMYIDFVRMAQAGIEEQKPERLPIVTTLNAIKPNPVNGLAQISFAIAEPSRVSLKIYDAAGRIIKTLVDSDLSSGVYNLTWNGTDENNQKVADGIYFYTLTAGTKRFSKKMIYTQ